MYSRVFAALMFVAAILFLLVFPPVCAQGITGSMTGTVTDSSGAFIVGATSDAKSFNAEQRGPFVDVKFTGMTKMTLSMEPAAEKSQETLLSNNGTR